MKDVAIVEAGRRHACAKFVFLWRSATVTLNDCVITDHKAIAPDPRSSLSLKYIAVILGSGDSYVYDSFWCPLATFLHLIGTFLDKDALELFPSQTNQNHV